MWVVLWLQDVEGDEKDDENCAWGPHTTEGRGIREREFESDGKAGTLFVTDSE